MRSRTMVYLDPAHHRALRAEAAAQGISMAEVIRRLVRRHLEERSAPSSVPPEAYLKVVGLGASGRSDISERHDAYLATLLRPKRAR